MAKRLTLLALLACLMVGTATTPLAAAPHDGEYVGDMLYMSGPDKAAVLKAFESLTATMEQMDKDIEAAWVSGDFDKIVKHYSPSWQTNFWGLTEARSQEFRVPEQALRKIVPFNREQPECMELLTPLASLTGSLQLRNLPGAIQGDFGSPDLDDRAEAVNKLQSTLFKQIRAAIKKLSGSVISKDPEHYKVLDPAMQEAAYVGLLRLKQAMLDLRGKVNADMTRPASDVVSFGGIYGFRDWSLKDPARKNLLDLVLDSNRTGESIYPAARELSFRGGHPGLEAVRTEIRDGVCGRLDGGGSDLGGRRVALANLRDIHIAKALELIEAELKSFTATAPNAQAIIAKVKAAGGAGSALDPRSTNSQAAAHGNTGSGTPVNENAVSLGGVTQETRVTGRANENAVGGTASAGATGVTSYTVKGGDSLGEIAYRQLYDKFIKAGWRAEDLPFGWGDTGVVAALARANNMGDFRSTPLIQGSSLNIPAVPAAPQDAATRRQAYQTWFQGLASGGPAPQPATPQPSPSPAPSPTPQAPANQNNAAGVAQFSERLKSAVGSMLDRLYPAAQVDYPDQFHRMLTSPPAIPQVAAQYRNGGTALNVLCQQIQQYVDQARAANGGRTPAQLTALEQAAREVRTELNSGRYNPATYKERELQSYNSITPLIRKMQFLRDALTSDGITMNA